MQNAKCKMQNAKCKMQNAKMQNAKCKMQTGTAEGARIEELYPSGGNPPLISRTHERNDFPVEKKKKKRTAPFLPAHCMDFKLFSEIVQKNSTKSSPWLDLRAVKFGGPGRGGAWRRCCPLPCTPASRPGRACSRTGTSKMFREIPTHFHWHRCETLWLWLTQKGKKLKFQDVQ